MIDNRYKTSKSILIVILFSVFISISIPIILDILQSKSLVDSEWLSFFSSYIGSIIGGIITLVAVLFSIKKTEEVQIAELDDKIVTRRESVQPIFEIEARFLNEDEIKELRDEKFWLAGISMIYFCTNIGEGLARKVHIEILSKENHLKADDYEFFPKGKRTQSSFIYLDLPVEYQIEITFMNKYDDKFKQTIDVKVPKSIEREIVVTHTYPHRV